MYVKVYAISGQTCCRLPENAQTCGDMWHTPHPFLSMTYGSGYFFTGQTQPTIGSSCRPTNLSNPPMAQTTEHPNKSTNQPDPYGVGGQVSISAIQLPIAIGIKQISISTTLPDPFAVGGQVSRSADQLPIAIGIKQLNNSTNQQFRKSAVQQIKRSPNH